MSCIYPVILSGGVGSRLWPVSRSHFPKQLLALVGEKTLIQETALRATGPGFAKLSIICHAEHRFLIAEQMRTIAAEPKNIILEPVGRNTAPAAAVAALTIIQDDPDAVLLLMPADHVIGDRKAFMESVKIAQEMAKSGLLVTFGIHTRRADTGYGYIQRGAALRGGNGFAVARFVEKPDAQTAHRYVQAGDYYWNSGMFVFKARAYLSELERLEPTIVAHCREAVSRGERDANFFRLAPEPFSACKSISIDYAVMEHTDQAAIVPVEMGWSDIGTWSALWDVTRKDPDGNVIKGDVLHFDTHNSYLQSEGPLIAALGVEDLVIVANRDAVLVSRKSLAQDVKKIVDQLERHGRDLHVMHRQTHHAWGSSECIERGENFDVYRMIVNVGATALKQEGPSRHWIVISGTAKTEQASETFVLKEKDAYSSLGPHHTLENSGATPLEIIEIRAGRSAQ